MPLSRSSKIKDVWRHPVGHDYLQRFLQQTGRSEHWPERPHVAYAPLALMDRIAGPLFVDTLLEVAAACPEDICGPETGRHAWWKEAVIYQVLPPSFMDSDHDGVGDLGGVMQRLPYIENLGADVIWLRGLLAAQPEGPLTDYRAVNPDFGTLDDLERLVEAAHARGIWVVMGLDISATSVEHPWFKSALAGGAKQDYYFFRPGTAEAPPNGWQHAPEQRAWRWHPELAAWSLRLAGRGWADLNWDNPQVRAEMAATLRFWLDRGVDGFYLGSANFISKMDLGEGGAFGAGRGGFERSGYGPRLHRYLRELRSGSGAGEDTLWLGEVRGIDTGIAKLLTGEGRGELDMVLEQSHLVPRPRGRNEEVRLSLHELRQYYIRWMEDYGDERWMSLMMESPDTPRLVSSVGAGPLYRAILAKQLGMWLLTLRGTPIIYQGQELGLGNTRFSSARELRDTASLRLYGELKEKHGEQAALRRVLAVTADHARIPMPWAAGSGVGFTGAEPWIRLPDDVENSNAAFQTQDPRSVLRFYQRLIALRRATPCLVYGSFNPVFLRNRNVFCYFRILGGEKWYVEMNLTGRNISRPARILPTQKLMLSNYDALSRGLRPYEANVYRC